MKILDSHEPFTLKLRIPRWATQDGKSYYEVHENVKAGDVFSLAFPFKFRMTKYTGGEEIIGKERWALEYGPLLYAVLGAPNPLTIHVDPEHPEQWLVPQKGHMISIKGDNIHSYKAYMDIKDEPFDVYPIVE